MTSAAPLALVVIAACGRAPPPSVLRQTHDEQRLVVDKVLSVRVNARPLVDLHWQGSDSKVGGYQIGPCILGYDQGMYQSGLDPGRLFWPAEYRYRSKPLAGVPVRWATWRKAGEAEQPGPYWVAAYVPGLQVDVACPTAQERDQAIAMLETMIILSARRGDGTGVDPARGPAEWSAAPELCTITQAPPVGGSGDSLLVVETAEPDAMMAATVYRGNETVGIIAGNPLELRTQPGTYRIEVDNGGERIRCTGIELVAGGRTTARIERFRL